ncbi:MAG TPA: MmgE/PrpD family protein [Acetobacteraceae bacterium]|nr:MmgE/PrpD family protein [Acetobacteraceae bacterium]
MDEPNAAELFAAHVAGVHYADIPPTAIERAKVFILDSLGVGIAGSTAPGRSEILAAARRWGAGDEATLWGGGGRLPAPAATMLNAFQMHCQEFDCVCEPAVLHPMATLLPAALAYAEREGGISGKALLTSVAVGVDVSGWIGIASTQPLRFFRPATAGGFGAAAAVARLAGLDTEGIVHAFGLLYTQTSGTMQAHVEAGPALPLQVGFNSRAALQAVDLALTGLPGPLGSIDGPFGYLPLMEGGYTLDQVRAELGRTWLVAGLAHKPYPAGRATHGAIEGVAVLRERHGFAADDVDEIVVTVPPLTGQLISRPDLPDPLPNYARLCTAFVVAKVLQHGHLDLSHYRGTELTDERTHQLAANVRVQTDSNPDPNALVPQRLVVRLRDGRELHWACDSMLASAERPLTREQHLAKFRRCCAFADRPWHDAEIDALIACVDRLETLADVRVLTKILG